jgi:diacylglycerol kinase (ATP)
VNKSNIFNVPHAFKAIKHALNGLKSVFFSDVAFRQELIILACAIPLAWYFGTTFFERFLLIAVWIQVLLAELINSALETIVDRIGSEQHPLSGRAKDIGSALILVTAGCAIITWIIIIIRKFIG